MVKTFDKQNWKGKNLLNKLEFFSFFLFYTIIIIIPFLMGNTDESGFGIAVIIWVIIGLAFYVIIFVAFQQYVYRGIADRYNGIPVMKGWMDQEEDLGEEFEFRIENMTRFERLSEVEKNSVQKWIGENLYKLTEFEKEGSEVTKLLNLNVMEGEYHD